MIVNSGRGEGTIFFRTLYNTDQSIGRYVLKAWLFAFVPSILIAAALSLAGGGGEETGQQIVEGQTPLVFAFGALLLSPWVETLLMIPILALYRRFIPRPVFIALASALTWAIFHSLLVPFWGLTVCWPFFIFSIAFLEWEKKSLLRAVIVTALIHTCQNLVPVILFLIPS